MVFLITLQPQLAGVVEGLSALLRHWADFENWNALPTEATQSGAALLRTREVTDLLQTLAVTREVLDRSRKLGRIYSEYIASADLEHPGSRFIGWRKLSLRR